MNFQNVSNRAIWIPLRVLLWIWSSASWSTPPDALGLGLVLGQRHQLHRPCNYYSVGVHGLKHHPSVFGIRHRFYKYKPLSYAVSVRELSELFTWLALWVYRCRKEVLKVVVDSKGPKYGQQDWSKSRPHLTRQPYGWSFDCRPSSSHTLNFSNVLH